MGGVWEGWSGKSGGIEGVKKEKKRVGEGRKTGRWLVKKLKKIKIQVLLYQ